MSLHFWGLECVKLYLDNFCMLSWYSAGSGNNLIAITHSICTYMYCLEKFRSLLWSLTILWYKVNLQIHITKMGGKSPYLSFLSIWNLILREIYSYCHQIVTTVTSYIKLSFFHHKHSKLIWKHASAFLFLLNCFFFLLSLHKMYEINA
jgi:hypothetical protein